MNIEIKEFITDQKEELILVIQKAFDRTKDWAKEKIKKYSSDNKVILVALVEDKIVGFIFLDDGDDDERISNLVDITSLASIPWTAVLLEYRKKGVGSKLLLEAENYLDKLNKKGFVLDCNEDKVDFYEKSGYKNMGSFMREEDTPPKKQIVMVKKDKEDWSEYYDFTREEPSYELLKEALKYVEGTGKAIDMGGGALRDTKYLLEKGFDVTVIDKSPLLIDEAKKLNNEKLHPVVTSFEDFDFPIDEYILASSMWSLHFCNSKHFSRVIKNIKVSLKEGGIFCGQMFGDRDQWSKTLERTYLTIDEARKIFDDMKLIKFEEEETIEGRTKHWHVYNFIARK